MPLQKSYSEHYRSSKNRQQWQRSKSHNVSTNLPVPQKPLQPVSEVTRNKLHAFDFRRPKPKTDDAQDVASNHDTLGGTSGKENAGQKEPDHNSDNKQQETTKKAAMTPISKLAWQDLIGGVETKEEEEDISPNERILWDTKQDATYGSPMITWKRGKKRARSSSPTSSPSVSSRNTPAVNVKKLSKALKSPRADPAIELWDRFSLSGSTAVTPLGANNQALAQFMVSSSPQPSKLRVTAEGGLRRAISCGTNWPKRRRLNRDDSNNSMDAVSEEQLVDDSKSSMVNALLKSVTGEINRSIALDARGQILRSPSPKKRQRRSSPRKQASPSKPPPIQNEMPEKTAPGLPQEDVSDYGDDDLDEDTLMELDASLAPENKDPVPAAQSPALPPHPAPPNEPKSSDDEFADMDDDILEVAEDLMTQLDSNSVSRVNSGSFSARDAVQQPAPVNNVQDLEDDFGDDFGGDFDFEAAEIAATQSAKQISGSLPPALKPKAIQRYLVTNVLQNEFTDEYGRQSLEKVDRSNVVKTIHLREDWVDAAVSPKSYVHVIGAFQSSGQCIIDNKQNILILHPDQLISTTVVADSFTCMRRAVLQDRVKATSEATPPLVYGTLLHEIFQEALMANEWSNAFLTGVINRITDRHVEDLYKIKVSMSDAREHLQSKMTELRHWAAIFVSSHPKSDAVVQGRNGDKGIMCVSKLLDVEEHVWSPMYGLKGNIDATVQVTMTDGPRQRTLTVPLEVKTGKNATSNHQAQTSLYNLLLSDRYDIEIAYGILYYMESSQTLRIPSIRHELRHMIMQRNQLACYVRERGVQQLPPMKKSTNTCGRCYAQTSCFIYHKLADNGDSESSGMGEKFDKLVKHLTPTHQEFFLKWEDLLTKEEKESQKLRRELWTMLSSEREKVGRCFANVMIEEGSACEEKDSPKINRYKYTFIKDTPAPGFSFLDSQLTVGEPIVVSDEQGHFALALGFVTAVRKQRISVAVDRRLHNTRIRRSGFDEVNNQVFASIMDVVPEGATQAQSPEKIKKPPIRYRLDKDEFSNGMATVRSNLLQIMANDVFGSKEIRRLVVDLAPPTFKAVSTQYTIRDQDSLNIDQRKAIEKVMGANDYALVLGMPGTGKTTTIAHIIRALVCQGKSVLLTSYTHSAVDNILLKLEKDKIPILRLGAPAKVHAEVQNFATLAGHPMRSFEEIRSAWHDPPIVATTCLGVNHAVFNERTFDYCIVDEASQITLPICLGPIRMARTFVLVGDHNQLPPLVQNEEARIGGLDISLFKLLSDTHPDSVVNLEHQYRMCEDVMALSNTLIYQGHLKCGTEELRHRKLEIPNMDALRQKHYDASTILQRPGGTPRSMCTNWTNSSTCWLRALLEPEARVRFINTDALPDAREEAKGNRIVNPTEARIVAQLVDGLLSVGVPAQEVGVMTHYRSQLALLKHKLRAHVPAVELHTADRFQGRDKEVVVLSLVRSNEACNIGDLLKDWRRINVAFTRAKTKLLVVGSRETLRGCGDDEMVSRFVKLMEERNWVHDLPSDALDDHWFEEGGTQITATGAVAGSPSSTAAKKSPLKKSPIKGNKNPMRKSPSRVLFGGKENTRPMKTAPKKGQITERALLRGKPIMGNIFHDIMSSSGGY